MTTVVKAANAAEFLPLVPRMLGFVPTRSVVLVPFAKTRSIGALRFDLPEPEADPDSIAATFVGMVCRLPDADAFAAVVYTDDRLEEGGMPRRDLVRSLSDRADECGLRLSDALCVGRDAWGSYVDPDCPSSGYPLTQLGAGRTELAALPHPQGDQSSGAALPSVDLAEKERVAHALASLEDAVDVLCGADAAASSSGRERAGGGEPRVDPAALAATCALDDLPELFEEALGWDPDGLAPYDVAAMIWCLSRPALRDIALVQWCADVAAGDEALSAQLRWEAGDEYPPHLAMQMWGEGPRPDPDRLDAALALVRRAAAVAPRANRPGPLATCAWLSWALGRSTHADAYADAACDIDPEHGLAEIVRSFVQAGHLPDWAFRRSGR